MKKPASKKRVFIFGFDRIQLSSRGDYTTIEDQTEISFVSFSSSMRLDEADGVIFPSGLFEEFGQERNMYDELYENVSVFHEELLQRQHEIHNLIRKGGWVCVLVQKIKDTLKKHYSTADASKTDLAKVLMNSIDLGRMPTNGIPATRATNDEFLNYAKNWGAAKTVLAFADGRDDIRILCKSGSNVTGVEWSGQIFLLPFHNIRRGDDEGLAIAKEIARAISDYSQKRKSDIPKWVSAFSFATEAGLEQELATILARAQRIETDLRPWRLYKGILTQSGEDLRNTAVSILTKFFGLDAKPSDEFIEDLRIQSGDKIICIGETKGTKKGLKREHINQVDSHRERLGLDNAIPGFLLINNDMSVESLAEREKTSFAKEHVVHAKRMNVLIMRSIDFLHLMKILETNSDRGGELLKRMSQGGGWLRATQTEDSVDVGVNSSRN